MVKVCFISQRKKTEMSNLAKKGSKPLLILVLLAVTVIGVGAALIQLYMKTVVNVHQVDTDFRGIDAQLMQAGGWAQYGAKTDVTSLEDMMHGLSNNVLYITNAAIMVIHSYDLPTKDLILSVELYEQGTTTPYAGSWTCEPHLVEFYREAGDGKISLGTNLGVGQGPWTITNAQIEDMVYDTAYDNPSSNDDNALILSFAFNNGDGVVTDVVYDEGWEGLSDFTTLFDMDVVLSIDDGT